MADKTTVAIYRSRVLEDYARDKPEPKDVDQWFESEAIKLEWPEKEVRKAVADHVDQLNIAISQKTLPIAQRLANLSGVTQAEALKTLREALSATKLTVKGDPKNGYQTWEHPDWPSRIDAIHEVLTIHGSHAPMRSEITGTITHEIEGLSDSELNHRIAEAVVALRAYESSTGRAVSGADGAQGDGRPLLLDDGMHEDEGRAESSRPVQAVSEETVPA